MSELLRIADAALVVLMTFVAPLPAQAIDYSWNNPSGGSWHVAANWMPSGVPNGSADTASIALAGTYTVTLASSVSLGSLVLGGPAGTQTLVVSGGSGGTNLASQSITVNANGVMTLTANGAIYLPNPSPPATLTNDGVIDLQGDARILYMGTSVLLNRGLVKKSAGSGTGVSLVAAQTVTNTGTFDAQAGNLQLASGPFVGPLQSIGAGNTFAAQPGASLEILGFAGGGNTFADTAFIGQGVKRLGVYSLTFSGTISAVNTTIASLQNAAVGTFTLNGTLTWEGGYFGGVQGNFEMTIPAGAMLVIGGSNTKGLRTVSPGTFTTRIVNHGTITFAGPTGLSVYGTPTILNRAGGLIDFTNDTGFGYDGLTLDNAGTLRKSAGAGVSPLAGVALTNSGTIRVHSGTLSHDGTFLQTAGTTELAGGVLALSQFLTARLTGGTLAGTGTVTTRRVVVGGAAQMRPGTSPGQLSFGGAISQLGTLFIELNGTTPGTQYDQLVGQGIVTLGGALAVSLGFVPPLDTVFRIVDNQSAGAVIGAFDGMPQGHIFTVSGVQLQIHYDGGDGNDVTLTVVQNSGLICTPFTDVDQASPFCSNVQWMRSRGVTLGCASTTLYCPDDLTTRLQMALFMNRLGNVLTVSPTVVEQAGLPVNPDAGTVVCQTANAVAAGYERRVALDGLLMGLGDGDSEAGLEVVASADNGASWISLGPPAPFGTSATRWSNVRTSADRDVAPDETVRYGLRLTRISGTTGFPEARCVLRVLTGNRRTGAMP